MEPTLMEGDRILINRVVYHFREPKSGDVVVFHSPVNDKEDLVKRVVAVAGDTVAVHQGALYVNGVAQVEPYLLEQKIRGRLSRDRSSLPARCSSWATTATTAATAVVRSASSEASIIGEAFVIYWPIRHWRGL